HVLALFQLLVDGEELLDLLAQGQREVLEPLVTIPVRIVEGHADYLVVDSLLVAHLEHPERLYGYEATRKGWLVEAHERVQRISVQSLRAAQIPVIGRVGGRAHQQPVELDPAKLRVVLVLVAPALGNLNDANEALTIPVDGHLGHTPPTYRFPPPAAGSAAA